MDTLKESPTQVKPADTPPALKGWTARAAAAVRWLRKDCKPFPRESDFRYAENCLWRAADRAGYGKMPRQLLIIANAEFGGSVRILDKDERAFIVVPDRDEWEEREPSTPRRGTPLEPAEAFPAEKAPKC